MTIESQIIDKVLSVNLEDWTNEILEPDLKAYFKCQINGTTIRLIHGNNNPGFLVINTVGIYDKGDGLRDLCVKLLKQSSERIKKGDAKKLTEILNSIS